MHYKLLSLVAATALTGMTVAAAGAQAAEPARDAARPQAGKAKVELICKRVTLTGSRMPKKVCQAAEDWKG